MVRCKDCGFLAIWYRINRKFEEAPELFREKGALQTTSHVDALYQPACFVRMADLSDEIIKSSDGYTATYREDIANLKVIARERNCDGYFQWIQGFHPKEHQEMLDRKSERRWRIAEGLIFAVTGAVVGSLVALVPQWAAKPVVPVINISPPSVTVTSPPITITVPPVETEQLRAKQSVPPKTTHDLKPPQP